MSLPSASRHSYQWLVQVSENLTVTGELRVKVAPFAGDKMDTHPAGAML
jgi:hypothetical protein